MLRALAIAAALAGVIVACGFHGQGVGPGDGGVGPGDSGGTPADGAQPPSDARPSDGAIIGGPDAMTDAKTVADGAMTDASASLDLCVLDAGMCILKGGSCKNGACLIPVTTNGPVSCPPSMPCVVECTGNGVCEQNIDCGAATSCTIGCTSNNTCAGQITCPAGAGDPCTIICDANNTCMNITLINGADCNYRCCSGNNSFCNNDNWGTCTAGTTTCN